MIHAPQVRTLRRTAVIGARWLPLIAWMTLIFWLSAQPVVPHPGRAIGLGDHLVDYVAHAVLFGVLALCAWWALGDARLARRLTGRRRLAAALGLAMLYAVSDELHQALVPGRCATIPDLLADGAGIAAGGLFLWLITGRHSP
ncbi:MAG: VanZ family protein [Chloroflexi bacterium]|nr:VanZ family protein [Chloroflexota bacterium]